LIRVIRFHNNFKLTCDYSQKLNTLGRLELLSNEHVRRHDPIVKIYFTKAFILEVLKEDIGFKNMINSHISIYGIQIISESKSYLTSKFKYKKKKKKITMPFLEIIYLSGFYCCEKQTHQLVISCNWRRSIRGKEFAS
jgi:hypothetical protein